MRLASLNLKTSKIKKAVYEYLTELGYFKKSPQGQRQFFYTVASLLMGGGIFYNLAILTLTIHCRYC